jgi:HK97 family phage major capsid protein
MKSLKELYADRAQLIADNRKLLNSAVDGKLTAEQHQEYEKRDKDVDKLSDEINARLQVDSLKDRQKRYEDMEREEPRRQTDPKAPSRLSSELLTVDIGRHKVTISPDSQLAVRNSDAYLAAYDRYLAYGEKNLSREQSEQLGLVVAKDDKGGYASPVAMTSRLIKFVDDNVFMRQLATVLPPIMDAVSLGAVSYDSDTGDADWTAEIPASEITEDDGTTFGKRELRPHLLTKLIKASDKFLRVAAGLPGGAANFLAQRMGYKFSITEEKAFLTGTGSQQPLGVFVASDLGISTGRDYTCASSTDFTADEVIDSLGALKTQYQDRATGLFSRTFIRRLRLKKDANGQYLWQPGLVAGQPDRVLNRPYVQSEHVPATFTAGLYVGMWGDFSWYWIQDSLGMAVQRLSELFQLKNQTGFLGRKETDGMPVLEEAFSRIKLKP